MTGTMSVILKTCLLPHLFCYDAAVNENTYVNS